MDQCRGALAAAAEASQRPWEFGVTDIIRRKPISFEEYWLASKAWTRNGLPLGSARALVNAGFLTVEDLHTAHDLELATIPRIGAKSLAIISGLLGREIPNARKSWRGRTRTKGGRLPIPMQARG